MRMPGIVVPGYDILRVANTHPLHPFPGNFHHERIPFLIVRETCRIVWRESQRNMLYRTFHFRAHGCLYLERVRNGLVADSANSLMCQQRGTLLLVLLVVGVVHDAPKSTLVLMFAIMAVVLYLCNNPTYFSDDGDAMLLDCLQSVDVHLMGNLIDIVGYA